MTLDLPPGPDKGLSFQDARELQRDALTFLIKFAETWGDISRARVGFWDVYFLNHPDFIQHILRDNWRNYGRDTFQFRNFARVTGDGLLTLDGENWQQHRRIAQPAFHQRQIADLAGRMQTVVDRLVGRWQEKLSQQREMIVDFDREMLRLALEIVGETLFTFDLSEKSARLSADLLGLMDEVIYRSQNLLAPPLWIPTRRNRHFQKRLAILDKLVEEMINTRRGEPERPGDLLDLLLFSPGPDGRPLTPSAVRDEMTTMIIAGYETVATGMGWIFALLAEHGQLQQQLRQSLMAETNGISRAQNPFLKQVINEAFRLYPPSWLITRRASAEDEIGGFRIPAGALIAFSPFALHRHAGFWPEATRFDPKRFDPQNEEQRHPYAYLPFGAGPHLCIGRPLALLEAGLTAAALVTRFEFELVGTPPRPDPKVTIRPHPALFLRLRAV